MLADSAQRSTTPLGAQTGRSMFRLQNRGFGFNCSPRSEFCNYAVGPWVSVAGRETALARGNPANEGI
jgi:hypothetical protein